MKRKATLEDIDEKSLGEMMKGKIPEEDVERLVEEILYCSKCSGILVPIEPKVEMGNLLLHECKDCKEREYK